MDRIYVDYINDVIITIHANIRELKERKSFADPEELAYIDGKLQAYNEMLSILKAGAEEFKLPITELGL
jgi:hypothetical protein